MIKASSHAHLPQPSLMLSQPVRLAPTCFCLSHSIARCQRGLLQTDIWPCWSPAEMTLGDSVHMSYQLTHSCLPHQCHFQPPCSVVPVPTVCMSSLAILLMLSVPFPSSFPGFYPFLLWGSAQLKPPPAILQIGLGAPSLCVYNNLSRHWLLRLQPCTHGVLFCLFVLIFFFLVCKRLREKSCIEIFTPTSAPAL